MREGSSVHEQGRSETRIPSQVSWTEHFLEPRPWRSPRPCIGTYHDFRSGISSRISELQLNGNKLGCHVYVAMHDNDLYLFVCPSIAQPQEARATLRRVRTAFVTVQCSGGSRVAVVHSFSVAVAQAPALALASAVAVAVVVVIVVVVVEDVVVVVVVVAAA